MVQLYELFGSKSKLKVLQHFLENPTQKAHAANLIKKIRVAKKSLFDALAELERNNFIQREQIGRIALYSLNREHPLVKQMKILLSISELLPQLKKLDGRERVFLYGSRARGENVENSDIDLLIITESEKGSIMKEISPLLKNRVKPVVFTHLEYSRLSRKDKAFYEEIEKDKIRLV